MMQQKTLTYQPIGNSKRGYRQREFEVSTFNISAVSGEEVSKEDVITVIGNLKKLGLTQIETGHAHHNTAERVLEACEKEELGLVYQDLSRFGGFQMREATPLSEEEARDIAKGLSSYSCVKGFYIWDEPWKDQDIEAARVQVDWFDCYAPDKLAFVAANPSYNPDYTWNNELYPDYIANFCERIQPSVLSMDYYPFSQPSAFGKMLWEEEQLDNSNVWKDISACHRESRKRDLPFWFYYQVIRMLQGPQLTIPMIRVQMNYAILYGAKALQCYGIAGTVCSPYKQDETRRIIEADFSEGCFYEDFASQVAQVKEWGRTLMALHSEHVYHSPELLKEDAYFNKHYREDLEDSIFALKELPFRCSVGILSDDYGNQYVGILNRDYRRSQTFNLPLQHTCRVYEVSYADGMQYCVHDATKSLNVTLAEGSMVLYRLQDCAEEPYTIEYQCSEA